MQKHNHFYRLLISIGVFFGRFLLRIARIFWSLKPRYIGLSVLSACVAAGAFLFFSGRIHSIFADGEIGETWNFATPSDYVASSGVTLDSSNTESRLSVKNYADDSDTVALYHFDESSGSTANDSSSNANHATVSGGSFVSGNLNNALSLNGTTAFASVPDSTANSLSQANTIEAWTKFSSAFSAGSHSQRQGIVDKGDYQLYYDNETGKLTYELANDSASGWTQQAGNDINGSWDLNGNPTIESSNVLDGNLYVGTGNGTGDAEVWKWNGTRWTQIGGDGLNNCWAINTFEAVYVMANDGTNLYVGLGSGTGDAEVWKWNGSTWSKIGGDALNSSWQINTFEAVNALTFVGGELYAGLGTGANDAEVWKWNGSTWSKIGGDSLNSGWTTNYEGVYSLVNDGTNVYAGLGLTAGDSEVWKWNGSTWSKIGGDSLNSSWDTTFEYVYSMTYFGGNLYVGLGSTAGDAEVWKWNGSTWSKIGGDTVNSSWDSSSYEMVYSLVNDGTTLYAGLGSTAGDNEVWSFDGSTWTKIGGDGVNGSFTNTHTIVSTLAVSGSTLYAGVSTSSSTVSAQEWAWNGSSWTLIGGDYVNFSWGFRGLRSVEVLNVTGDYLYAGTGVATIGNAMVWQFDGTTWTIIGGQGVNGSWDANTYETVTSLIGHGGELYAGLGSSSNDAEVWHWNGSTWEQIGGDSLNSGWTTGFEEVNSLASYGGFLYAGLGNSANDAEVWRWNGSTWTKVGGDSLYSGWTTNFERVTTLGVHAGKLYAGLGSSAGDAEVWECANCDGTPSWSRVGGDGINSSWANSTYEQVDSMIVYAGFLYVGLGTSTDDAEVWKYDGSSWTLIGGDDIGGSWSSGTYERVRTLAVYNGALYAGLGTTAGDGEVWRYAGSLWAQAGGDNVNGSWGSTIEEVGAFSAYKGKFYAGTGNTANADAAVWSFGNNAFLQSSTSSFNTNWHHVAATYNGSTMSVYIDGTLNNSRSISMSIADSSSDILIGTTYAGREYGKPEGFFQGSLDELRISSVARTSFQSTPYSNGYETVTLASAVHTSGVKKWDSFVADEDAPGNIAYRLSSDGGSTWQYWSGSAWATSSGYAQSNDASTISTNIPTFPAGSGGLLWQAVLLGNGNELVRLNSVTLTATADLAAPTWSGTPTLAAKNASGGLTDLTTGTWYSYSAPYFEWSAAADTGGSGVAGYYVYFGTSASAEPTTQGDFQVGNSYTATVDTDGNALVSGQKYYLIVKAKDVAQNTSVTFPVAFSYWLDSTAPTNPLGVTAAPAVYSPDNDFSFLWSAGTDGNGNPSTNSMIAGYQYQIAATVASDGWSSTTTALQVDIADAAYQTGENFFYLRTIDVAGNVSASNVRTSFYYAGAGPTAPQNVQAIPATNTANSFAFTWDPPFSFSGDASDLTYCYTVNAVPSEDACTFTAPGVESVAASAFATQKGTNTFYVVAKNPEDLGGVINYGAYETVEFVADTSAPGIPLNTDIADVSVKNTESWKLAVSWEAPADIGSGVDSYQIYHSLSESGTYTKVASTSGIAFVDTGLTQALHYYKIRACDSVNNCGAFSEIVSAYPTGKYTEAAGLASGPSVSLITTKSATIGWSTDRASDSKVQYGKGSGDYYSEEPSNSEQVTDHEIKLSNLSPGTTYHYRARWTDEDGNTGLSGEKSFKTDPAPTVIDPNVKSAGLSSAILEFTARGASKVKIYYGLTEAFGLVKEISTSTSETTYTTSLEDLLDGTKYYYKINTVDSEEEEYEGNTLSFETLPRPKIEEVRIQQVKGTAQTVLLISWKTNTETSSIVTYVPEGNAGDAKDEVDAKMVAGEHRILLRDLLPQTSYSLVVRGRDNFGNEAKSDALQFTTATDTRAPQIIDANVEGLIVKSSDGSQGEAEAQLVITWTTDESATSQVEYGEGTGSVYPQKTQEDASLVSNHTVVISKLTPSKVYHLRVLSKDKAGNVGESIDIVSIAPKATENALDIVFSSLKSIFGQ